jgi:Protein of unknown function (DUF1552)
MIAHQRRFFLKAVGLTIGLPLLESIAHPSVRLPGLGGYAAETTDADKKTPVNMVCIGNIFGFCNPPTYFFPTKPGADYDYPLLLEPLKPHKKEISIYSGLDHGVTGGHFSVHSFLSGVLMSEAKNMPEGNISLDQRAAETIAGQTRYPSLTIGSEDGLHAGTMMCWTRSGSRVPPIAAPKELFTKLFVNDSPETIAASKDRLRMKKSIPDGVHRDALSNRSGLSQADSTKLDEYFNAIRDIEKTIEHNEKWSHLAKPKTDFAKPVNTNTVHDLPILYDLMVLALQSGTSRIVTLELGGSYDSKDMDIHESHHLLSHHGQLEDRIGKLLKIDLHQMQQFARFIGKMKATTTIHGQSLLDNSMVLFGSGMGNANSHRNSNLPIILAGGGFKHGEYKAFPDKGLGKIPLCNLYLSMLHRFGVETNSFGASSGTFPGLV